MGEVRDEVATYDSSRNSANLLRAVIIRMDYDGLIPTAVSTVWSWEILDLINHAAMEDLDTIERLGDTFAWMRLSLETGRPLKFRAPFRTAWIEASDLLSRADPALSQEDADLWGERMAAGIRRDPPDDPRRLAADCTRLAAFDAIETAWQALDRGVISCERRREIRDRLLTAVNRAKTMTELRAAEAKAVGVRQALEREMNAAKQLMRPAPNRGPRSKDGDSEER